ncbi:MAG: sigma-54 dependent transcriptional regulator [Kiritimatiellae bacterium]|nr:sigma-54 dependent transcriptional regulator [Verrucomicrobiota bacterium]MBU4289624.1 sigma-54 dependent transcriptional regulator [Verrucomicrobiota bacterium]MCG2680218.1 sigma-54 dependent transcriptional regulator [Kiritimatiellia bacterium]
MAKILLVDDEPSILSVLSVLLKAEGYEVVPVDGGKKAVELIKSTPFDLMISDIRMRPIDGMALLKLAREQQPSMSVLMVTGYGSVETAVEALKDGAFDYITKPFRVDELLITVQRALEYNKALTENVHLKAELVSRYRFENIIAESPAMRNVCEMIERVAPTDATVLIYGESGTGKELVAKAIHAYSNRKAKNFLPLNCAALPEALLESELFGHVKGAFTGASSDKEGLFEVANGGTILLDEISSMPLNIQAKLLRVLQDKEIRRVGGNSSIAVDVRVLAATNSRLETLIEKGAFREDLYYRLSVIPLEIKPLRERAEDILPFIYHFLRRELGTEKKELPTIDPDVIQILEHYSWPGNVRELENAIKHAFTFAKDNLIKVDCLPAKIIANVQANEIPIHRDDMRGKSLKAFLRIKEKEYLSFILKNSDGDKQKAAKSLKISLATLYRKLPEPKE